MLMACFLYLMTEEIKNEPRMKRSLFCACICACVAATSYSYAGDLRNFIEMEPPVSLKKQCAYKKKIAAKPCTVSTSLIKPDHPITKKFFGKEKHVLLTIKWPDGDTSRYALLDSHELINLGNSRNYRFKVYEDDESEIDTTNGVIILDGDTEHVRLW